MLSQYFGSFLLNKGYITRDTLNEVLSQEKKTRIKLGVLAVSNGLLTADQVDEVHNLQKAQDKRFGEIAIELNYLTEDKLNQLLSKQKSSQAELSQILIDEEIMDIHTLEKAIADYQKDINISDSQFKAIRSGSVEDLVEAFVNMPETGNSNEYIEYISLFIRNIIRFIDSSPVIKVVDNITVDSDQVAVKQDISGDSNLSTYMSFSEPTYVAFASQYAEMKITERNELADASVTEFLNLHNGIFVVNMSEQGVRMQLSPPEILRDSEIMKDEDMVQFSIDTELGVFYFILGLTK